MTGLDAELDLTPRPAPPVGGRRRWLPWAIALVALGAAGFVLYKGVTEATLFFLNADEAVEQKAELGDDRFRLQGTVVDGTIVTQADGRVTFTVTYNDVDVDVVHQGDPEELLDPEVPVVLEGRWVGSRFESDTLLNKHDPSYEAENPERLDYDPDEPPSQSS